MKPHRNGSSWFRAAFLVQFLALILDVVGFVTNSWIEHSVTKYSSGVVVREGLWRQCTIQRHGDDEPLNCIHRTSYQNEGWFVAVKTFESFGLACLVITVLITMTQMFVVSNHRWSTVNCHVTSMAGIFILMGNGVFAYKTNILKLGYSCWLCWLVCGILEVSAMLLDCDNRKSSAKESNSEHVADHTLLRSRVNFV